MSYEVDDDLDEDYGFAGSTDILDLPDQYYGQVEETPGTAVSQWIQNYANTPAYAGYFAASVAAWEIVFRRNQDPVSIAAKVAVAYGGYRLATGVLAEGPEAFSDREQWLSIALIAGGVGYSMLAEPGLANIYEL
ncbi:hypothetical protein CMI47_02930 [Candidatus Pacearchaeota archaeon]|nr:hypothetical protein [Candidatus Pacearchaeota archaeon]